MKLFYRELHDITYTPNFETPNQRADCDDCLVSNTSIWANI